jgi:hypothetical protein
MADEEELISVTISDEVTDNVSVCQIDAVIEDDPVGDISDLVVPALVEGVELKSVTINDDDSMAEDEPVEDISGCLVTVLVEDVKVESATLTDGVRGAENVEVKSLTVVYG